MKDIINAGVSGIKKLWYVGLSMIFCVNQGFAASMTIGGVADQVTGSFAQLAKLITAGAYMAGLGFAIGAIMKFKQHKDNPTQVSIGAPIALLFVSAALLFLPTILSVTGSTIFGDGAEVAGPTGTVFGDQE